MILLKSTFGRTINKIDIQESTPKTYSTKKLCESVTVKKNEAGIGKNYTMLIWLKFLCPGFNPKKCSIIYMALGINLCDIPNR